MDQYSYKEKDKNAHLFNQGGDIMVKKMLKISHLPLNY